ncbi:MAG: PCRF domain-containing protein [Candidatus Moeniiplasma glomeromycotorum]|nr:PCRF domain-containing protein [Candidatus Moeniiplasma glomeromycotorum]
MKNNSSISDNKEKNDEELTEKIIDYLKKLEKGVISPLISDKKKNLLLVSKKEYEKLHQEQEEYQELSQEVSQEEQSLILTEIKNLTEQKKALINKIKEQIIEEENISQNIIMEIRPGAGGDEAGLFVNDLYCMYASFAAKKGWKVEMIENKVGYDGAFSFVSFLIKGEGAFNFLKNEAGVHRVQRIPETEKYDRKQTSTATVVVLPEPQDIALNIRQQDLKIETSRSGGAGGQHVNTTDSKVQITHLPTGVVAISQDGRSQHDNKSRALAVLKSRLWEKLQSDQQKKIGNLRSSMIGTAERSENFRTYNFPGNRVIDKRLNIKLYGKLEYVMEGDLEEICQRSIDYEVEKKISKTT